MPQLRIALCLGFALAAVCESAESQFPHLRTGVRAGGLLGRSDLADEVRVRGSLFVRHPVVAPLHFELNVGYGRLGGGEHETDLGIGAGRLLLAPAAALRWTPYLFAGVGLVRHDIDRLSPRNTPGRQRIGWTATAPGGGGVTLRLSRRLAVELEAEYTYTLRDDLDGAALSKGNDGFWSLGFGLVFRRGAGTHRPLLPVPLEDSEVAMFRDRDGDGLSDWDETRIYFTNPLMVDSDGDKLGDGDEVTSYRTSPNRRDTDNDGMADGRELDLGFDPLVTDHVGEAPVDVSPELAARVPLRPLFFPSGAAGLTARDSTYLEGVAQYLLHNEDAELEVLGHSDNLGTWQQNLRLSGRRCGAVRDYLVSLGVDHSRLILEAFGERQPIAANDTPQGRAKNRRVELAWVPPAPPTLD